MLLHPIQNIGILKTNWIQKRPRISQFFGENPDMYKKFNLNGHNGIDIAVPVGTPVFAPCDGMLTFGADKYLGTYVVIVNHRPYKKIKVILAHLSKVELPTERMVNMGEMVGLSGNTGNSTGPHLHMTVKRVNGGGQTIDTDNGFRGAEDFYDHLIYWKGAGDKYVL